MIIVMQHHADDDAIDDVVCFIRERGLQEHISRGTERTIIGAVGDERVFEPREIEVLRGVEKAVKVLHDWRIISRQTQETDSVITVRGVSFGGVHFHRIAPVIKDKLPDTAAIFFDPFFRPNTPYAHDNGLPENERLAYLNRIIAAAHQAEKPVLVRVRDIRQLSAVLKAEADFIYLGGELMAGRDLQEEIGRLNVPVVLCKDKHHQTDDWLIAAEHIALKGNHHIILGEAGTLCLDRAAPYRLDIEAMVKARQISHLPIIANILHLPHAYMRADTLLALSLAAGAHGVITAA
ncbi:chorismate mutase [Stenoxybacter acetivorans]|uniref:chorismate mutase n=1 Tax=Stenoxybacter acetivorans TaxID=422441 RepID=UPI00056C0E1B|nr:chorismate mutase [Stenoxybacter acetivorans]